MGCNNTLQFLGLRVLESSLKHLKDKGLWLLA